MRGSTAKSQILAVSKIKNSELTGFSSDSLKKFNSPDFNPDELVWAHLKGKSLKAHQVRTKEELRSKTLGKMRSLQKKKPILRQME